MELNRDRLACFEELEGIMKTKLVYVLTSAPEKHYIEQALIAVFSARYWNKDACIVLIVDDLTDQLLVGKRAEILDYVTEKIVVPFEDSSCSPMYRSRWIKTSVRHLVDGDMLFVDCDTVCNGPLLEIDNFDCEIAMVPDEHLPLASYNKNLIHHVQENAKVFGFDVLSEKYYFNSGVMLAKDIPIVRDFWKRWHDNWVYGEAKGVKIDQPSLSKTNFEFDHAIDQLPDVWNTLVYMNPAFIKKAKILHFWQFRNRSFLFGEPFLAHVETNGIDSYVRLCVLNPIDSVLPSLNVFYCDSWKMRFGYITKIRHSLKQYANHIDNTFKNHPWIVFFNEYERRHLNKGHYYLTSFCMVVRMFISLVSNRDLKKSEVYFT